MAEWLTLPAIKGRGFYAPLLRRKVGLNGRVWGVASVLEAKF
ncbi:hypothetical protein [Spirulina subsalsa]|nr:hypothetical protein [Spirulina subsalsa]